MFEEGASATENSPIGYGNDIVLENNAGYAGPFGDPLLTVPGPHAYPRKGGLQRL
jgi:hypothetical protein